MQTEKTEKHTPLQVRPPRILCNTGAWNPLVDTTDIYAGNRGFNREDLFTPFDAPVGIQFEVESALKSETAARSRESVGTSRYRSALHLAG